MHKDRLITLRNHLLNNVQDSKFYLEYWIGNNDTPWDGEMNLSCGTTACAMGHAALIPEFQALGLSLKRVSRNGGTVTYDGMTQFSAVACFLDISIREADYLFNPEDYLNDARTTRMEVIDRIDYFLQNGLPENDE